VTEWHPNLSFLFMRLFMALSRDDPEQRVVMLGTPLYERALQAIAESETPRLVLAALEFIASFFRFPIIHLRPPLVVKLDDDRRSALCEAIRSCFQRNRLAGDPATRRKIGTGLFKCITNLDFWDENFETPLRAGLHLFFMASFLAEPEPLLQMGEWLDSLWVFERDCFLCGATGFIEGMIGEIPVVDLACLVLGDEGAPAPLRAIQAGLEQNPLLYDRMKGHICAILTRLIVGSGEVLPELNSRHFFAGLLVDMENRGTAFKFDAMFLLAVAFQRLGVSELADFMIPEFVQLLESIELSLRLPNGLDLSAELVTVAYRLNELLDDDADLKSLLYETVPEALRCTFEDMAAPA
jgi:hypothetical protein